MTERLSREHPRDCPHGRQWGKCDTCDLLEAQGHIAALEAENNRLRTVVDAATQMRDACPMEWTHGECDGSQCAPVCCALDALDEES